MEFTHEQISEIISEITNGEEGLQGLVKQVYEFRKDLFIRNSYTCFLYFMFDFDDGRAMVGMFYSR